MKRKSLTFLFLLVLSSSCFYPAMRVSADVPMVLEVTREKEGDDTVIIMEIRHSNPTPSHYVDIIEVDVDGEVRKVAIQEPQTATTFMSNLKLEGAEPSNIVVRANCNVHGWSTWTGEKSEDGGGIGIPGNPYEATILGIILGTLIIWILRREK